MFYYDQQINSITKDEKEIPVKASESNTGNDYIHNNIGLDTEQSYDKFHHFLLIGSCKNCSSLRPMLNNKVHEFFNWLQYTWKISWNFGPTLSVDEQTCLMQVKRQNKTWSKIQEGQRWDPNRCNCRSWIHLGFLLP